MKIDTHKLPRRDTAFYWRRGVPDLAIGQMKTERCSAFRSATAMRDFDCRESRKSKFHSRCYCGFSYLPSLLEILNFPSLSLSLQSWIFEERNLQVDLKCFILPLSLFLFNYGYLRKESIKLATISQTYNIIQVLFSRVKSLVLNILSTLQILVHSKFL